MNNPFDSFTWQQVEWIKIQRERNLIELKNSMGPMSNRNLIPDKRRK